MRAILAAVILAALMMVPFILQRGTTNQLRAENSSLSNRVAQLSRELAEANQSKNAQPTNQSGSLPREQLHELMRLRAEVGELRRRTNSTATQTQATARAATTIPIPDAAAVPAAAEQGTNTVVTGPWRNAGFAQPADAAQTLVWTAHAGTIDAMMSAMTPEAQAEVQQQIASGALTAETLKRQFSLIHSLHPSADHQTTETEAFFTAHAAAPPTVRSQPGDPAALNTSAATQQVFRFQKVGDQWLYAGRVNP
jgi:hypothetical protein